ncbi:MAG: FcoT family thioesterase [Candidatus Nanoarchaeia archaeon]|nr:FcoT family thioesterase [Candidatus Nanoarchaeia archaeon]
MQIPQERLNRTLELYKLDCMYLIEASIKYPKAEGKFNIGDTYYTTKKLEHMTSIEAQLCLNQLCYSAFGEWLPEGRFEQTINFEEFLELMKENMFIINSNIRFRKPIPTNEIIQGYIKLNRIKKYGNLYIAFLDYDLEQGKSMGKMELALKL